MAPSSEEISKGPHRCQIELKGGKAIVETQSDFRPWKCCALTDKYVHFQYLCTQQSGHEPEEAKPDEDKVAICRQGGRRGHTSFSNVDSSKEKKKMFLQRGRGDLNSYTTGVCARPRPAIGKQGFPPQNGAWTWTDGACDPENAPPPKFRARGPHLRGPSLASVLPQ